MKHLEDNSEPQVYNTASDGNVIDIIQPADVTALNAYAKQVEKVLNTGSPFLWTVTHWFYEGYPILGIEVSRQNRILTCNIKTGHITSGTSRHSSWSGTKAERKLRELFERQIKYATDTFKKFQAEGQ